MKLRGVGDVAGPAAADAPSNLPQQYECGPVHFSGDENASFERHLVFDRVIDPKLASELAKLIIKLINNVAAVIDDDPAVRGRLKAQHFGPTTFVGYETLLYDCITGDQTLFQRADFVEAGWRAITPILDVWSNLPARKFPNYAAGDWGPPDADELLGKDGRQWRCP